MDDTRRWRLRWLGLPRVTGTTGSLPTPGGLSLFIAPFLLLAFCVLYRFPGQTQRLFAWTIRPTMTPMVLASAYLGGFYFFVRLLGERRWAAVKTGFASVALFASLLGIPTVLHWDRFNHRHVALWLWGFLYFGPRHDSVESPRGPCPAGTGTGTTGPGDYVGSNGWEGGGRCAG